VETGGAGEHVPEAVAGAQAIRRTVDLERERTVEHQEMVLEPGNRRRVECHRGAGRDVDLDELSAEARRRRRHGAAVIAAFRILPLRLR
jgi:hypothetical protein